MNNPFYSIIDTPAKESIANEIRNMQDAFAAVDFTATIKVVGTKDNGEPFSHEFLLDETNAEFKNFLNEWGARRSAQLL